MTSRTYFRRERRGVALDGTTHYELQQDTALRAEKAELSLELAPRAGAPNWEQWDKNRRMHTASIGVGRGGSSIEALREATGVTFACRECSLLVDRAGALDRALRPYKTGTRTYRPRA